MASDRPGPATPWWVHAPAGGALHAAVTDDADLAAFYADRRGAPIWTTNGEVAPQARALLAMLQSADRDGLDPERLGVRRLQWLFAAAQTGDAAARARLEAALSAAFADYVVDLHDAGSSELAFIDPALPQPPTRRAALTALAAARTLDRALASAQAVNPVYAALREAWRAAGASSEDQPLLRANMERTRGLPANLGARYILVDVATRQLQAYEDGRAVLNMPVGVGQPRMPTPSLAGLIRSAVYNPYWYMPPDLVRERIAPRVLATSPDYLAAHGLEVLSDWSNNPSVADAASVDWSAVARGDIEVRVRQRPGGGNAMGQVKFMLPNRLGVYLHDTSDHAALAGTQRLVSAGCVRLSDAEALARWLDTPRPAEATAPERAVDLPSPVPVYIVYLTRRADAGRLEHRPDIYGRDARLLAALGARQTSAETVTKAVRGGKG